MWKSAVARFNTYTQRDRHARHLTLRTGLHLLNAADNTRPLTSQWTVTEKELLSPGVGHAPGEMIDKYLLNKCLGPCAMSGEPTALHCYERIGVHTLHSNEVDREPRTSWCSRENISLPFPVLLCEFSLFR